jgi:hypothetical protein
MRDVREDLEVEDDQPVDHAAKIIAMADDPEMPSDQHELDRIFHPALIAPRCP